MIAEESEWKNCVQGSTAVVNLAGLPISTRWSPEVSFFLHLSLKFVFVLFCKFIFACFADQERD